MQLLPLLLAFLALLANASAWDWPEVTAVRVNVAGASTLALLYGVMVSLLQYRSKLAVLTSSQFTSLPDRLRGSNSSSWALGDNETAFQITTQHRDILPRVLENISKTKCLPPMPAYPTSSIDGAIQPLDPVKESAFAAVKDACFSVGSLIYKLLVTSGALARVWLSNARIAFVWHLATWVWHYNAVALMALVYVYRRHIRYAIRLLKLRLCRMVVSVSVGVCSASRIIYKLIVDVLELCLVYMTITKDFLALWLPKVYEFGASRTDRILQGTGRNIKLFLGGLVDFLSYGLLKSTELHAVMKGERLSPEQQHQIQTLASAQLRGIADKIRGNAFHDTSAHDTELGCLNSYNIEIDESTKDLCRTFDGNIETFIRHYALEVFNNKSTAFINEQVDRGTKSVEKELVDFFHNEFVWVLDTLKEDAANMIDSSVLDFNVDAIMRIMSPQIRSQTESICNQYLMKYRNNDTVKKALERIIFQEGPEMFGLTDHAEDIKQLRAEVDNIKKQPVAGLEQQNHLDSRIQSVEQAINANEENMRQSKENQQSYRSKQQQQHLKHEAGLQAQTKQARDLSSKQNEKMVTLEGKMQQMLDQMQQMQKKLDASEDRETLMKQDLTESIQKSMAMQKDLNDSSERTAAMQKDLIESQERTAQMQLDIVATAERAEQLEMQVLLQEEDLEELRAENNNLSTYIKGIGTSVVKSSAPQEAPPQSLPAQKDPEDKDKKSPANRGQDSGKDEREDGGKDNNDVLSTGSDGLTLPRPKMPLAPLSNTIITPSTSNQVKEAPNPFANVPPYPPLVKKQELPPADVPATPSIVEPPVPAFDSSPRPTKPTPTKKAAADTIESQLAVVRTCNEPTPSTFTSQLSSADDAFYSQIWPIVWSDTGIPIDEECLVAFLSAFPGAIFEKLHCSSAHSECGLEALVSSFNAQCVEELGSEITMEMVRSNAMDTYQRSTDLSDEELEVVMGGVMDEYFTKSDAVFQVAYYLEGIGPVRGEVDPSSNAILWLYNDNGIALRNAKCNQWYGMGPQDGPPEYFSGGFCGEQDEQSDGTAGDGPSPPPSPSPADRSSSQRPSPQQSPAAPSLPSLPSPPSSTGTFRARETADEDDWERASDASSITIDFEPGDDEDEDRQPAYGIDELAEELEAFSYDDAGRFQHLQPTVEDDTSDAKEQDVINEVKTPSRGWLTADFLEDGNEDDTSGSSEEATHEGMNAGEVEEQPYNPSSAISKNATIDELSDSSSTAASPALTPGPTHVEQDSPLWLVSPITDSSHSVSEDDIPQDDCAIELPDASNTKVPMVVTTEKEVSSQDSTPPKKYDSEESKSSHPENSQSPFASVQDSQQTLASSTKPSTATHHISVLEGPPPEPDPRYNPWSSLFTASKSSSSDSSSESSDDDAEDADDADDGAVRASSRFEGLSDARAEAMLSSALLQDGMEGVSLETPVGQVSPVPPTFSAAGLPQTPASSVQQDDIDMRDHDVVPDQDSNAMEIETSSVFGQLTPDIMKSLDQLQSMIHQNDALGDHTLSDALQKSSATSQPAVLPTGVQLNNLARIYGGHRHVDQDDEMDGVTAVPLSVQFSSLLPAVNTPSPAPTILTSQDVEMGQDPPSAPTTRGGLAASRWASCTTASQPAVTPSVQSFSVPMNTTQPMANATPDVSMTEAPGPVTTPSFSPAFAKQVGSMTQDEFNGMRDKICSNMKIGVSNQVNSSTQSLLTPTSQKSTAASHNIPVAPPAGNGHSTQKPRGTPLKSTASTTKSVTLGRGISYQDARSSTRPKNGYMTTPVPPKASPVTPLSSAPKMDNQPRAIAHMRSRRIGLGLYDDVSTPSKASAQTVAYSTPFAGFQPTPSPGRAMVPSTPQYTPPPARTMVPSTPVARTSNNMSQQTAGNRWVSQTTPVTQQTPLPRPVQNAGSTTQAIGATTSHPASVYAAPAPQQAVKIQLQNAGSKAPASSTSRPPRSAQPSGDSFLGGLLGSIGSSRYDTPSRSSPQNRLNGNGASLTGAIKPAYGSVTPTPPAATSAPSNITSRSMTSTQPPPGLSLGISSTTNGVGRPPSNGQNGAKKRDADDMEGSAGVKAATPAPKTTMAHPQTPASVSQTLKKPNTPSGYNPLKDPSMTKRRLDDADGTFYAALGGTQEDHEMEDSFAKTSVSIAPSSKKKNILTKSDSDDKSESATGPFDFSTITDADDFAPLAGIDDPDDLPSLGADAPTTSSTNNPFTTENELRNNTHRIPGLSHNSNPASRPKLQPKTKPNPKPTPTPNPKPQPHLPKSQIAKLSAQARASVQQSQAAQNELIQHRQRRRAEAKDQEDREAREALQREQDLAEEEEAFRQGPEAVQKLMSWRKVEGSLGSGGVGSVRGEGEKEREREEARRRLEMKMGGGSGGGSGEEGEGKVYKKQTMKGGMKVEVNVKMVKGRGEVEVDSDGEEVSEAED